MSIAASTIYDGDNKARSVGGLNGGGKILNTDGLTVQSGDFAGIIDNSNTSLTKTGAGTLTLTGNNAYTGSTTISDGTLKGNIASGTDLSIADSATYDGDNKARPWVASTATARSSTPTASPSRTARLGRHRKNQQTGSGHTHLDQKQRLHGGTTISEGTRRQHASGTD